MTPADALDDWVIPHAVMTASIEEMAIDGRLGNEGVALWLGRRSDTTATVTHVVVLRGSGVRKRPDLLVIDPDLLNDVTDFAIQEEVLLIGQIHSHGTLFGTNLSKTDRAYGIKFPDFLSVVAPHYAQRPGTTIANCGVHVYRPRSGYVRLSPGEVEKRIRTKSDCDIKVVAVGG